MPETLPAPVVDLTTAPDRFPSHVTKTSAGRVFGLDLLRALAIVFVLIVHCLGGLTPYLPWWFGFLGHGGFYGVELFFVLSGFLIGTILIRAGADLHQPAQLVTFYIRRWFRTLPLFLLFVIVNVSLEAFIRQPPPWSDIWRHTLFVANLSGMHMTFFGESWSLAIEEWFYLLFPLVLFLGLRVTRNFNRVLVATALAFFLFSNIGRMLTASAPYANWPDWQRRTVLLRFDGLMLGVFAAWTALRYETIWRKRVWLPTVVGLILLAVLYASLWTVSGHVIDSGADNYFARTFRFTLVSFGFALLLPFASTWKLSRDNIGSTIVRRIALWSYALYLVHTPVIETMKHYLSSYETISVWSATGLFVLRTALIFAISALLYRYFESRCTHLRDRAAPAAAKWFR